ncbi:histidine phosphotransferase family protein [Sphingomonas sp.]|uniref:histidine phosphotransferase family protein n=1 Tax=Sphingomonas sp. TaxID=28214 RepID=UPI0035BBD171
MTVTPVDLASLMCSRLCHDLLSPVGALNNGLELLADETDPAMRERCMELLADSARTSANKLKFFRLAFGAAGGFGDQVDVHEARQAIEALLAEGRNKTLAWLVEAPTLPKAAVKVLLNLSLIGGDALVRGGTLSIGAEENGGQVEIVVQGEGPRILLDAEIARTLTDGEGDSAVTARTAAGYMIHAIVAERGGSVQVSQPADGVLILGATLNAS